MSSFERLLNHITIELFLWFRIELQLNSFIATLHGDFQVLHLRDSPAVEFVADRAPFTFGSCGRSQKSAAFVTKNGQGR